MSKIFDYARNKIKKEYRARYDYSFSDVKETEYYKLWEIDYYEKKSKGSFKNAIICRIGAFLLAQTEDEKIGIFCGGAVFAFVLLVFLFGIRNIPLKILFLNLTKSFFGCFVFMLLFFLYRLLRKRVIKSKIFYFLCLFFFILSIPYIPRLFGYETTQIGDFYEAEEYTEGYYVLMSRESESNPARKVYRLPAKIERRYDYVGTSEITEDMYGQIHGGDDLYYSNYHILYLYFPNGGSLNFDYDYAYEDYEITKLIPGKEMRCEDSKDETYYITLTKEKAKK